MNAYSNVQYSPSLQDNSLFSRFEKAAYVCQGPERWLDAEIWGTEKKYFVKQEKPNQFVVEEIKSNPTKGMQKVLRIIVGLSLFIPGKLLSEPLMFIAERSEEIRLKHKIVHQPLSEEEKKKLAELISQRQTLDKQRQGEPITCGFLFCVCCLICCLFCCCR